MAQMQELALTQTSPSKYDGFIDEESLYQQPYSDSKTRDSSFTHSHSPQQRYFGNNKVFFWRNNQPLCNFGPHWYVFLPTWIFLIAGGFYCYAQFASNISLTTHLVTISVILWEGFIYMLTALKNPGIASAENPNDPRLESLAQDRRFCPKCRVIRDETTAHCWDCNVCIRGYDHHCPWTGKCIGAGNLYPFYLFLGSTAAYMVYFMMFTFDASLPKR